MVAYPGEPMPTAEANSSFTPLKKIRSVASELDIRASVARDAAHGMPLGDERTETLRKVTILENAAEMLRHFLPKVDAPAT
jgi:hypothetical protein